MHVYRVLGRGYANEFMVSSKEVLKFKNVDCSIIIIAILVHRERYFFIPCDELDEKLEFRPQ